MIDGDLPCYNWNNPEYRPPSQTIVAIVVVHWKGVYPLSYEIVFGVAEHINMKGWRVTNNDDIGQGSCSWYPARSKSPGPEEFVAWMAARDFTEYVLPSLDILTWFSAKHPTLAQLTHDYYTSPRPQ